MSSKLYSFSRAKRILLVLSAVACLFVLASQSSAKTIVFSGDQHALKIINAGNQKAKLVRFLHNAGIDPKSIKMISKKCGCTAASEEEEFGFGHCLKGCLGEVGVSAVQLILCAGACAAAWTGAGAIVCALCVGVDVTVVVWCSLGCSAYPQMVGPPEARNSVAPPHRFKQAARAVTAAAAY